MKKIIQAVVCTLILSLTTTSHALEVSVSVNFAISTNDNNSVNPGESAVPGLVSDGAVDTDGSNWNHVLLGGSRTDTSVFVANTQGGNSVTFVDSLGNNNGSLTSTGGTFFSAFSNATDGGNRGLVGEAGLMQSYLLINSNEQITISGLDPLMTRNGYDVFMFFEIGDTGNAGQATRNYGLDINSGMEMFFTDDLGASDSDNDNDGLMEWIQATGNTQATATTNGNYAVVRGLTDTSFTINGINTGGGRAVLSGIQIVGTIVPEPTTATLGLIGLAGLLVRRRRAA